MSSQNQILFNPTDSTQLVSNSSTQVLFYSWVGIIYLLLIYYFSCLNITMNSVAQEKEHLGYSAPEITDKVGRRTFHQVTHLCAVVMYSAPFLALTFCKYVPIQTFNMVLGSLSQSIFHYDSMQALTATSAGNIVLWDKQTESVSSQPIVRKAMKIVFLQKEAITVLTLIDRYI